MPRNEQTSRRISYLTNTARSKPVKWLHFPTRHRSLTSLIQVCSRSSRVGTVPKVSSETAKCPRISWPDRTNQVQKFSRNAYSSRRSSSSCPPRLVVMRACPVTRSRTPSNVGLRLSKKYKLTHQRMIGTLKRGKVRLNRRFLSASPASMMPRGCRLRT